LSVNRPGQRASGWVAEALTHLRQSLLSERDALVRDDFDLLTQAVQGKEQALRQLATLSPTDSARLREALRPLHDLNEHNARLLAPRIRLNRARVETLLGVTQSNLYSASGRASAGQNRPQRGVRA
jgi:flagellar biosynthesis/type III secretory pathway chaperone